MNSFILKQGQRLIERGAWFFAPISWIWAAVVFFKNKAYDLKFFRPHKVKSIVISVGNIVAGGTGKTPFVKMLAEHFAKRKVAILSRGYGKLADEAMMLQRHLPHVPIYVGKDRRALASRAVKDGAELILLDDGFQHRKLHRDFDIVLLRSDDPLGKGHYLPWGFLRDSPKRLKDADAVFLNGKDFRYVPSCSTSIQGLKVGLFSGIANPSLFKKSVCDLGAEVVAEWILADHEAADPKDLNHFAERSKALGANVLVTTEKDFIKGPRSSLPILFLEIKIEWHSSEKWLKLIEKIDQKLDNNCTYGRADKD